MDDVVLEFLGVDYGSRVIGVARINTLAKIGEPLNPIRATDDADAVQQLESLCHSQNYDAVVIGLPRNLEGNDTQQTEIVRKFALKVKENLETTVYLVDEAGSTVEARARIGNKQVSLDSVSAVVILENFISHADKKSLEVGA